LDNSSDKKNFFLNFFRDPNLPLDGSWSAHQPRAHWFLQFNYSSGQSLQSPGILKKDYRFEEVAFWNNYLPAVNIFFIYLKNNFSNLK